MQACLRSHFRAEQNIRPKKMSAFTSATGVLTLTGSCFFLAPTVYRAFRSGDAGVSSTYLVSKAVQLSLQSLYGAALYCEPPTKDAGVVMAIGVSFQWTALGALTYVKLTSEKRRRTYHPVADSPVPSCSSLSELSLSYVKL